MQIIENIYKNYSPLYPIENICSKEKALFMDIETTGLSKEKTSLYLIGCGYYIGDDLITKLFFADSPDEELELLNAYIDFQKSFSHLFHFNGTKFDIPYLEYKAKKYNIDGIFDNICQVDVYIMSKPLRQLLFPVSMRQKCIEEFMQISREDKYNGGELIEVYHSYCKDKSPESFNALITHNLEDVLGMHKILPILHYLDLMKNPLVYQDHFVNEYTDFNGNKGKELIINYTSNVNIPKSFNARTETLYLKANAETNIFSFRLPIITCDMKRFYENYRDYYYLKYQDCCIHKSAAMGLEKSQYIKATKENCYQKITGDFVKQPCKIYSPSFKQSYKDKCSYFLFPDSFDESKASEFGNELLNIFFYKRRPAVK